MYHFRTNTVRRLAQQHANGHPISKDAATLTCEIADTILADLLVACSKVAESQKQKTITPSTIGYVVRTDRAYKRVLPGYTVKPFLKSRKNDNRRKKIRTTPEKSG